MEKFDTDTETMGYEKSILILTLIPAGLMISRQYQ